MNKIALVAILGLSFTPTCFAQSNFADPKLALRCHEMSYKMNTLYERQESKTCQYLVTGTIFEAAGYAIAHNRDSMASMALSAEINLLTYANAMGCNGGNDISSALVEAATIKKELDTIEG